MSIEINIIDNDFPIQRESLSIAYVVCFYQWKILFVREFEKDFWSLTGGERYEDESIWECAKRQLAEQTGIEDTPLKFQFNFQLTDSLTQKSQYGSVFKTSISSLPTSLPESEIEEVKIFEEIPDNIEFEYFQDIIENID